MLNKVVIHLKKCRLRHVLGIGILAYIFLLSPRNWFDKPYSTVVFDNSGGLLGARIADDGQWRFPTDTVVSPKVETCLLLFEDEYFYYHIGFNPVSLVKATIRNIRAGKVVSGGSTITMQLTRIYRGSKRRSIPEKLYEILLATRVEAHFSKKEIVQIYLNNAPFGGNVVGIEAAAWRYFGRSSKNLSWAEAATLAILPNSPALIHPGRNRATLLKKRNNLLLKLLNKAVITQSEYRLALLEEIPDKPLLLVNSCKHLTEKFKREGKKLVNTSISGDLQRNALRLCQDYLKTLAVNNINNIAAVIADVRTNKVLAYIGNYCEETEANSPEVDIAQSPRSTGSIIKPLLYASMLQEGALLPTTLVPDIPTRISGFKPDNYEETYDGVVPAKTALSRSLNVPIVRMLQNYGVEKFYNRLKGLGMSTLNFSPDHYGLTLVVGGAEGKLFDLVGIYANLANVLNNYNKKSLYYSDEIKKLNFEAVSHPNKVFISKNPFHLDAGSIYLMYQALLEVNRPNEEVNWKSMASSRLIGWKTGTSYGFRDAWAIGTTPEYVVGVWVGNAYGEGRPGLIGVSAAAPLMFQLFNLLPSTSWFNSPYDELDKFVVCRQSGFKAGRFCTETDTVYSSRAGVKTTICPYHKMIQVTADEKYRVNENCAGTQKIVSKPWFILPPAQEWYYAKKDPFYKKLPPFRKDCGADDLPVMEIVYPAEVYRIFIPRELDGKRGKMVIEIAHRNKDASLFWQLDRQFITETRIFHQVALSPEPGWHTLTVVDNEGNSLTKKFLIMN